VQIEEKSSEEREDLTHKHRLEESMKGTAINVPSGKIGLLSYSATSFTSGHRKLIDH
jgi:hypothetical protein